MKYVINSNNEKKRLVNYNVNIDGLMVSPVNNVPLQSIKVGEVVLADEKLQESYIKQRINRKIDKIIKFMLRILNDDDTTDDDSALVLDEVNRLKGIVINKYRHYMKDEEYKSLLTKLILVEEEFKKSMNEKMLLDYSNIDYYDEELETYKSR